MHQYYHHNFKFTKEKAFSISVAEILVSGIIKDRAFVYELNSKKDFVKTISRHEDKLAC
jgi:hypothetical protein